MSKLDEALKLYEKPPVGEYEFFCRSAEAEEILRAAKAWAVFLNHTKNKTIGDKGIIYDGALLACIQYNGKDGE